MRVIPLGTLAGQRLSAHPSAIVGTILLWAALAAVGIAALHLAIGLAVGAALIAVAMHWGSVLIHQFGHVWAARRTGHPTVGIRLWWVLSTTRYPADEPPLPAAVHIRRALGGPIASAAVTLVALVVVLAPRPLDGVAWWLALFALLDNLLVLTSGTLLPLGFTDGSTLLRWWGKS